MEDDASSVSRTPFPSGGIAWNEIERLMDDLVKHDIDWRNGRAPLFVFHATNEAYDIGKRGFAKFFSENPQGGTRAFFGLKKMEDDLIDFGLGLMSAPDGSGGATTTGGSESIFVSVKAARDFFRSRSSHAKAGNIVVPYSAHPAFNKAAPTAERAVNPTDADHGELDIQSRVREQPGSKVRIQRPTELGPVSEFKRKL